MLYSKDRQQGIESSCFCTFARLVLSQEPLLHQPLASLAQAQSDMTSSSCLSVSLWSPLVFTGYIIIRMPAQILINTPVSSMPPTQFMRQLCWRITCFLFILGNSCISRYSTLAAYMAFPPGYLRPVYFTQQVHFLLCYQRNLRGMSKGSLSRYLALAPF